MKNYIKSIILITLCLGFYNLSQGQIRIRGSIGLGVNKAYKAFDSRSLPWTIVGEYQKVYPGVGSGMYLSYASYTDEYGTIEPGISFGVSNTAYISELLDEMGVDITKFTFGGKLSPYVSLLVGLNFGAGFNANNVIVTEYGVQIFTAKVPIGIAFYPIKNIGVFCEFFGPQSKVNGGLTFRFGNR